MSFVVVTEMNQVAYVKLHRPEVRNSFNPEMIAELTKIFTDLEARKDLRAVVLQGEGKVFCAGADLNWMKEMVNFTFEQNREDSLKLFGMFEAIAQCSLPVIGMIHGAAFGGALGLVAVCDEVIAEENTQFCFSEVKLGIAPAVISAFVNKKAVAGKVRPLMLSGVVFNSHIAQQAGLVTEVVPVGEGHTALQKVLHGYMQCGPDAVRETKKLLNDLDTLSWADQRSRTTTVIAERRASNEGQEGLKSFLEKREPAWRLN
ncbi:enoyl-CoA hydratase-related protein [Bdellovibrio bacteriovorus]|uniref:Enoyl-CoA hydratase/isomerase family protein n=1 Tax=Bdellovibrio bacteriovorus (strain ATCC 15356 / DSM 50701 / NCIMB 9529 / HD100) TaxID=264462 RepID=Q6MHG6_BDEBA|nr:enoyl-CoA hydratase-related protein [Bdellovibrio bacteriovorus]CAE80961.1 enoyl-CoA hydratase/isomerase family protein [Bdellovibrio bacteriovorus HD100]